MAERSTAVALLFDDGELGGQLRDALHERGARIVHEGPLSSLSRAMLDSTGAEVLVVNLDEEAEDELDRLYDVIDGDRPRVVFNDAQASRQLEGWDRARWARHLAVKVMAEGDLDPPRPQHAQVVSATEEHAAAAETLAAELEALLAADEQPPAEDDFGEGLKFNADDELPPLHDGRFGVDSLETQGPAPLGDDPAPQEETAIAKPMPSFQLDHLALTPIDESFMPAAGVAAEADDQDASPLLGAASSWSLVEDDALSTQAPPAPKPSDFGIEKLSAAEFLAPEGGSEESSAIHPGMSLELVSIEEAIAPTSFEDGHEMLLADLDGAISRVLVLGAAADSVEAVCTFLSHLPGDLRVTVLHVQHLDGKPAEVLAGQLAAHCPLPVSVAAHGARARMGQVLVVPEGQQVRVQRDGTVELQPLGGPDMNSSPIDASFTLAASVFGRHAQAIVFAGEANDGLGGCQAIHDRGGRVWVETSPDGHFADMVHGIEAERLHSYSGTPAELAARLVQEMSMEGWR
ncbi:chemotaxis protein CheB [Dyella sedimenti]|uniref:chemotaxis protein CheB n=1 Tax=Dyella sedimenti TaxID=2919947 RepID=UPI001FAB2C6D|nr:chemotaxis protein CheB [Dyella sedimenti]